jgi:hypothetical protein
MDTNPPVLWLRAEKARPDATWELIIPITNRRVRLNEELSAAFDELYLTEQYLVPLYEREG